MAKKRKRTRSTKKRGSAGSRSIDHKVFSAGFAAALRTAILTESPLFQAILEIMRRRAEVELKKMEVEVVVQEAEKASMGDPS